MSGQGRPGGPPQIIVDIDRAMRAGDFRQASQLAERALATGLSHPILFSLRATARRQRGELDGALADLEAARRLNPKSANVLVALAEVLRLLGRFGDAAAMASEALALDRRLAPAWFQKGLAEQLANELEAAASSFREAVRFAPGMAEAQAQLANLAALQGHFEEARAAARRVLALRPADEAARLALLRVELGERRYEAADSILSALLGDAGLSRETRAVAVGLLGDLRDAQDRTAEAFAAYRESGALQAAAPGQGPAQARESARQQVARLTQEAGALPPGLWRRSGPLPRAAQDRSKGIAFILGFPRSGTTLLAQILAADPGVAVLEEKPIFAGAVEEFLTRPGGVARLAALPDETIARWREDVWRRVAQTRIDTAGKLVVDQNAFNTAFLPLILRLFPEAPIVFALRDPRDVAFGAFRRHFGHNLFTAELLSLEGTVAFYEASMRLAETCRDRLGFAPLDLRNEDLVADFEAEARRLCDRCGVPWTETMRSYQAATRDRTLATVSSTQVRQGISGAGVGQWRRYATQMAPVLPALAPWVARFGYAAD